MGAFICDYQLKSAMQALSDPLDPFRNPLTSRIGSMQNKGWQMKDQITTELLNPVMPLGMDPTEWTNRLAAMGQLSDTLTNVFANPSNFASSKMGQFKSYTDFMSGKNGIASPFPANVLSGQAANIVGVSIIASATFMTVVGVASGANSFNSQRCKNGLEGVPNLPLPSACENSNSIFATVLGAYNGVLDGINGVIQGITGFIQQTAGNLLALQNTINTAIDKLMEGIVREVTKLAGLITEALRETLAKMFKGMASDPCAAAVLSMIAPVGLVTALNLSDASSIIPNLGIPNYL